MSAPANHASLPWRIKERLQFTGWLQYVPTGLAALVCLAVAALGWGLGVLPMLLFWPPLALGALLGILFVFDVVTSKFGLRPPEPLPPRKDGLDTFDLMRGRRSCRSFQARNLTDAHRVELLQSVRRHTSPGERLGERPVRFEYVAAPLTVWPVVGAREFLVAIGPRSYDRVAVIDVGRCLQKVVLDATRMGLATCWIGPGADQASVVKQLGERFDPEADHVICVCAVGYASWFKPLVTRLIGRIQHRRLPLSELFFADPHFRAPLDVTAPPFERFGRCYEVCQWSPSSFNEQTTRCAAVVKDQHVVRFDFCAATTSRYYAAVALGIWCANWETGCEALGILGRFAIQNPAERMIADVPELPRYDVSWILDAPL